MESTSPILLTDRTTIETDWTCGQKRYWYKEYGSGGIVPKDEPAYFEEGRDIHDNLANLAGNADPLEWTRCVVATEMARVERQNITGQLELETLYRRLGWLLAFAKWIEPGVRAEYETISVEGEVILDRAPLWIACTPDRILRRRDDGRLVYREYKTTKKTSYEWMNYWPHAVQLHLGIKAVEEEMGERMGFAHVQGLFKGYVKEGKLRHPYTWAYSNGEKWQKDWKGGWDLRPVWEYPGGLEAWVDCLGEEVSRTQCPYSAPIFLDDRLVEELVEQVRQREQAVRVYHQTDVADRAYQHQWYFPQRFSQCRPMFGSPCAYREACWNASVGADPIGSGIYVTRTPHHEVELVGRSD